VSDPSFLSKTTSTIVDINPLNKKSGKQYFDKYKLIKYNTNVSDHSLTITYKYRKSKTDNWSYFVSQ